ncbi:MAG: class I SAM-dependent methyltransferase [Bacilli bacterium]|jgi:tRNA (adenine22-N1)-methyltransferase
MIRIGKRLKAIAEFIDKCAVVADVGADHGKLLLHLANQGVIAKGYGIENKPGPFRILKDNLDHQSVAELLPVFQDGITKLENDVDTIVLAGMGGDTIVNILKDGLSNLNNVNTIITDSHTSIGEVRRYIIELDFIIQDEVLVDENRKYYEIIKFIRSDKEVNYSDFEYRRGPIIIKSPEFRQYAKVLIKKIDVILAKDLPQLMKQMLIQEREALLPYEN